MEDMEDVEIKNDLMIIKKKILDAEELLFEVEDKIKKFEKKKGKYINEKICEKEVVDFKQNAEIDEDDKVEICEFDWTSLNENDTLVEDVGEDATNVDKYFGEYSKKLNVSIYYIESADIKPIAKVTNGLVYDLFRYFSNKANFVMKLQQVIKALYPMEIVCKGNYLHTQASYLKKKMSNLIRRKNCKKYAQELETYSNLEFKCKETKKRELPQDEETPRKKKLCTDIALLKELQTKDKIIHDLKTEHEINMKTKVNIFEQQMLEVHNLVNESFPKLQKMQATDFNKPENNAELVSLVQMFEDLQQKCIVAYDKRLTKNFPEHDESDINLECVFQPLSEQESSIITELAFPDETMSHFSKKALTTDLYTDKLHGNAEIEKKGNPIMTETKITKLEESWNKQRTYYEKIIDTLNKGIQEREIQHSMNKCRLEQNFAQQVYEISIKHSKEIKQLELNKNIIDKNEILEKHATELKAFAKEAIKKQIEFKNEREILLQKNKELKRKSENLRKKNSRYSDKLDKLEKGVSEKYESIIKKLKEEKTILKANNSYLEQANDMMKNGIITVYENGKFNSAIREAVLALSGLGLSHKKISIAIERVIQFITGQQLNRVPSATVCRNIISQGKIISGLQVVETMIKDSQASSNAGVPKLF